MGSAVNPLLLDIPMPLLGECVLLRPWVDEDAPHLWALVDGSREHLAPWMPWIQEHVNQEFTRTYIRRSQGTWSLREDLALGIFLLEAGGSTRPIGATGLHRIDWSVPSMEIGYWIHPAEEGKGYVSESLALVRDLAFRHLHAERLMITCNKENQRSAAVPRRCGFVHEATLRNERRTIDGRLRDTEVFAMTRADFDALQTSRAG